jgi:hypothetical protein
VRASIPRFASSQCSQEQRGQGQDARAGAAPPRAPPRALHPGELVSLEIRTRVSDALSLGLERASWPAPTLLSLSLVEDDEADPGPGPGLAALRLERSAVGGDAGSELEREERGWAPGVIGAAPGSAAAAAAATTGERVACGGGLSEGSVCGRGRLGVKLDPKGRLYTPSSPPLCPTLGAGGRSHASVSPTPRQDSAGLLCRRRSSSCPG